MPIKPNTPPIFLPMSKTQHQGYGSRTDIWTWEADLHVPLFWYQEGTAARFPVSGPIPGTVTPVCGSGIGSFGKTNTVFLPVPPPIPLLLQLLMAFKCAVVVSTIAVKRSNKAAASEAGMNGGQTDSTEFHLGQGEAGKGDSLTDLLLIGRGSV